MVGKTKGKLTINYDEKFSKHSILSVIGSF